MRERLLAVTKGLLATADQLPRHIHTLYFTSQQKPSFGGGTLHDVCSGPRRPSSSGTLSEFRLCRGTLLCDSRKPRFSSRHCVCWSGSDVLTSKQIQLHQNSPRVQVLSWHSALQFHEAELSPQFAWQCAVGLVHARLTLS